MSNGKIEFELGDLRFSGEGTEEWLAIQLQSILTAIPQLRKAVPPRREEAAPRPDDADASAGEQFNIPLATYLTSHRGNESHNQRFLVAADWLRRRGVTPLSTKAVVKALRDNHQSRLSNPSENLNRLVGQGLCEKNGGNFFITPQGLDAVGR